MKMHVKGYCPHGCGRQLEVLQDGTLVCTGMVCPDPHAIDRLLNDTRLRATLLTAVSTEAVGT
jgi:hypothetical protein